jgi:predicted nucleic acid-binding protein
VTGLLLDTNVISELKRARPDRRVTQFIDAADAATLFTCDVVIAEIRYGIETADDPTRRQEYKAWLDGKLRPFFAGRILSADEEVWLLWKTIVQRDRRRGISHSQPDVVIAAIAIRHGFAVVTRDAVPFERAGAAWIEPWTGRSSTTRGGTP